MDNKKIYIGLGIAAAVGVAYYFWSKKKSEVSSEVLEGKDSTASTEEKGDASDIDEKKQKYKLIKDFVGFGGKKIDKGSIVYLNSKIDQFTKGDIMCKNEKCFNVKIDGQKFTDNIPISILKKV